MYEVFVRERGGMLGHGGMAKVLLCGALVLAAVGAEGQATDATAPDAPEPAPKPVPMVSGFGAFIPTWQGGSATLITIVTPVVLVPLGEHWLVESRGSFEGDFTRPPGGGPFGGAISKNVDYLQLDYIANPYVTVTAGRYLTPFGIFNERLYPNWIRALQTDPLIIQIEEGSGTGAMLRGGFPVSSSVNLNYAAYFSALSTNTHLASTRMAGGRAGLFFTGPRLEIGASFQHLLQDDRSNVLGMHLEWQPRALPLDLRSEYSYSENGKGYWLEGAYRLSQARFWHKAMSRTQVVARVQNFYLSRNGSVGAVAAGLPDADTSRVEIGVNYFLRDGLKAVSSYGRTFSAVDGNSNLWTVGVAYRFAFPLGHGR